MTGATTLSPRFVSMMGEDDKRLQAQFWHSPFAVCAGVVVTVQVTLMFFATLKGYQVPFDALMSLTVVSMLTLVAGVWPEWNYVSVSDREIVQHAGLTTVNVPWDQVISIETHDHSIQLTYVIPDETGAAHIRTSHIFNRYGMTSNDFAEMIEKSWQKGSGHALSW